MSIYLTDLITDHKTSVFVKVPIRASLISGTGFAFLPGVEKQFFGAACMSVLPHSRYSAAWCW
ncbi:MAG TPA: hypothetical protein VLT92_18535 [Burkholderiales bacterium]|nr:hypothetical protein [Burkholderiales bacterium]